MKWRVPGQEVDQRKLGERKALGLNREDAMDRSRWRKQIGLYVCVCCVRVVWISVLAAE